MIYLAELALKNGSTDERSRIALYFLAETPTEVNNILHRYEDKYEVCSVGATDIEMINMENHIDVDIYKIEIADNISRQEQTQKIIQFDTVSYHIVADSITDAISKFMYERPLKASNPILSVEQAEQHADTAI